MKTTKQIRDERAVIKEQMRELVERAEADNRDFLNDDEQKQFDAFNADIEKLSGQLATAERIEKLNAQKAAPVETKETPKVDPAKEYETTFWKYAKGGNHMLTAKEIDIMSHYRGTGNQTTTAAQGGYTIPQGFSNQLEVDMAAWGGMLANANIVRTETGQNIKWPYVDDTSTSGALLSEGTTDTVADMTFSSKDLDAYTYSSNTVKVSRQLLQDSYFELEGFLREAFARRLGTAMNAHFTTGTGSSQPNGVVTAASVGTTSASNSAVTRSELVNLAHSVDPAYRANAKWMFNDTTLALIKKLAFGSADARPLWQLSMRDGEPDRIEGYQYFVNQDTADFGAGNKPIAFGDFSKYIIRLVGAPEFLRLNERYADALLVGFMAFHRADGELIADNAIKVLRNPTT
jgi:HK97 family phage major capsid protein